MSLQDRSNPLFFQSEKKKTYSPQCKAAIPRCSETNTQFIRIFCNHTREQKKARRALLFSPFSHTIQCTVVNRQHFQVCLDFEHIL